MGSRVVKHVGFKEVVDEETGEIVQVEVTKYKEIRIGREEEFYMTYCKHMAPLFNLTYADDIKVLIKLCQLCEFGGRVMITQQRRLAIIQELKMHTANFSKALARLKDKNLITGEKGEYQLNHLIFWKGDRAKRIEALRDAGLSITFNFMITDKDEPKRFP